MAITSTIQEQGSRSQKPSPTRRALKWGFVLLLATDVLESGLVMQQQVGMERAAAKWAQLHIDIERSNSCFSQYDTRPKL